MKVKEINELETKDLNEKLEQAEAQLRQMKLNHQISPLEDSSLVHDGNEKFKKS